MINFDRNFEEIVTAVQHLDDQPSPKNRLQEFVIKKKDSKKKN